MSTILKVSDLTKKYRHADGDIYALNKVSFTVDTGDFVTITGSSGSGKTTLLLCLAGLIKASEGAVQFQDFSITSAADSQLSYFRKQKVGFVMQSFALIPYLTAAENVMLPLAQARMTGKQKQTAADEMLHLVGLENRKNHLPRELSAGQRQRVAIARAIINKPELILADEPTGNLDPTLSTDILDLLSNINKTQNLTILIVTHSPIAAAYGNRKIHLKDGEVV